MGPWVREERTAMRTWMYLRYSDDGTSSFIKGQLCLVTYLPFPLRSPHFFFLFLPLLARPGPPCLLALILSFDLSIFFISFVTQGFFRHATPTLICHASGRRTVCIQYCTGCGCSSYKEELRAGYSPFEESSPSWGSSPYRRKCIRSIVDITIPY